MMKPSTKYFIKEFISYGIPFAIFMSFYDVLEGDGFYIWKFILHAGFFGLFMAGLSYAMTSDGIEKYKNEDLTDEDLKRHQKRTVISSICLEELYDLLLASSFFKEDTPLLSDIIQFRTGWTWRSKGEVIEISVEPIEDHLYEYHISSRPKWMLYRTDSGKNFANVSEIVNLLNPIHSPSFVHA